MSKKKATEEKATQEEGRDEVLIETSSESAIVQESEQFRIGEWHGMPNYGCPHCEYKTIQGETEIMWHIHKSHPEKGE